MSISNMVNYCCNTPEEKLKFYNKLDNEIFRNIEKQTANTVETYEELIDMYTELKDNNMDEEAALIDLCFIAITGSRLSILIQNTYADIRNERGELFKDGKDH